MINKNSSFITQNSEFAQGEYQIWIKDLKTRFRTSQIKAAIKVNSTLLEFYWELGADIVEKQKNAKWGTGFLKQVSQDLRDEFPDITGFSYENLKLVRRWYRFYYKEVANRVTDCYPIEKNENLKQNMLKLFLIPWSHNIIIISKCNSVKEALFYVNKTIENGWSRAVLTLQIKSDLYEREGQAITNFSKTLPDPQSDLAHQILKSPYNFDFLTLTEDFKERELEMALLEHIEKFLLELGAGFAFVGRQYKLKVSTQEFAIDLIFYHLELRCFVVIDLKLGAFKPEYAGKMNFYCNVIDDQLKKEYDNPTIGIILCQEKDKVVVEYSLNNIETALGVSEYELATAMQEKFKSALPTIEELEAELNKVGEDD